MGNDPFFIFGTLELRANYLTDIKGSSLPHTCTA